jgi:hypothetical protein
MKGEWLRKPTGATSVVFVHGILSSGEVCWRHANGSYWPELLNNEPEFNALGIYVYSYQTGFGSGSYSLSNVVDDLKERVFTLDKIADSQKIIFVCHSMGGIVVRKFLVERVNDLLDRQIEVGLYLVASPSLGSEYANWLEPIAKFAGHAQAQALRFSQDNQWLNDLDKTFINLKESHRLNMRGKELIEDQFVTLKFLFRKQVVPPFSGARYFGESFKVAGSNHSSIAKPQDKDAVQHRLLMAFILEMNPVITLPSDIGKSTTSTQPIPPLFPPTVLLKPELGALASNSSFYVGRDADTDIQGLLGQRGATVIVKGAGQMGKTSLFVRVEEVVKSQECVVCNVDFQMLDEEQLLTLKGLLHNLLWQLAQGVNARVKLQDFWDDNLGAKQNATHFMEDVIFADPSKRIVLMLDKADRVFNYGYRTDFFGLLRSWHNQRAYKPAIWDRFSLLISISTDPSLWMEDNNQSPFNVGQTINLKDFTVAQSKDLAGRYGLVLCETELQRLRELIGGHPHLTQQALYLLAKGTGLDELVSHATDADGDFADHLRHLLRLLSKDKGLSMAMKQILQKKACEEEASFQRLFAAGLVTGASRHDVRVRCGLYENYFYSHL